MRARTGGTGAGEPIVRQSLRSRRACYIAGAVLDLSPGSVFADQFEVVRPLAKGGMGAVYVVKQLGTGRERALKLMHPMLVSDERSLERFEREAKVGSVIESDHVVEVIAAGVERASGTPWLCMELLRGETLADRIERQGALGRGEAIEALAQLSHALSAAHAAGIVHRDLKPENVFLAVPRREGIAFTLKVLDFGVAALVKEAAGAKTTQGVGSPMWMAPEQTDAGKVTRATDVWAIGLIAYYLLTGRIYWRSPSREGASLTALLVEIMVEPLSPPSERATEGSVADRLPPGFDAWFAHCVHRDPTQRFQDVAVAIGELIAMLRGEPARTSTPRAVPQAFEATAVATGPLQGTAIRGSTAPVVPVATRSRRWVWFVGGIAAVMLLGCGVLTWSVMAGMHAVGRELAASPPHLVVHDDEATVELGPNGLSVVLPDGGQVGIGMMGPIPAAEAEAVAVAEQPETEQPETAQPEAEQPETAQPEIAQPEAEAVAAAPPRAPRAREPRAPRLAPHEAQFVSAIVQPCWQGNPMAGLPRTRVTFELQLGQFDQVTNLRITGLEQHTTFRRCMVMRGTTFRYSQTPPEIPVRFTTLLGPS